LLHGFLEEAIKHVLLGQLLQQLEDEGHIIVTSPRILSLPSLMTLCLSCYLHLLVRNRRGNLVQARLDRLLALLNQLINFFLDKRPILLP